jgi:ADP-ribose pyrophosphatase YjhB (NUDIX family)
VPSVNVVVANDQGEILLIRRTDNDNWTLPGGAMDIGESIKDAAVREVKDKTGFDINVTVWSGFTPTPDM